MTEAARRHRGHRLDRLTTQDASYLRLESHGLPTHVAALAIVDGAPLRDGTGRLKVERIREHLERRTRLAPRLRQVLRQAPFAGGSPIWVDDPSFDIRHHLRVHDLGPGADEARLLEACADLNQEPMDRALPLWEMWLLTGRADGGVALPIRLHHVVADGVAALDILGLLFDPAPDSPSPAEAGWSPRLMPPALELYADRLRGQGAALSRAARRLLRPREVGRHLGSRLRQLRWLSGEGLAPRTSLNQPVGRQRRLMLVRADLADVRAVAHAHEAKINDVVLAAVAGGARALVESRGELTPDLFLKVSVAASLRGAADGPVSGNQVGIRLVPVPVGEPDAVRRLRQIAAVTGAHRGRPAYQPGGRLAQRWMVRTMFRQRLVNLLLSNLPGPRQPVYFAGATVLELFQVGLVQGNLALTVGVLSYASQLSFDIVADAEAFPDLPVFTAGLSAALEELCAVIPTPRVDLR